MGFQPFGYAFEVVSLLPPHEVKAAMRAKMKDWFDPKSGPRGWIAGPFVCLWITGLDAKGPMLLARIRADGSGARIGGRAGSNINGIVWFAMIWTLATVILLAQSDVLRAIPLLTGIGFFGLFILWLAHRARGEADPLVRFIRQTIETPAAKPMRRTQPALDNVPVIAAKLVVNGEQVIEAPSTRDVADALLALQFDEFIVIEFAPQIYMQAALIHDRFVLEKRDGGADRHHRASGEFEREEMVEMMTAYLAGQAPATRLEWGPLHWKAGTDGQADLGKFAYAIGLILAVLVVLLFWTRFA